MRLALQTLHSACAQKPLYSVFVLNALCSALTYGMVAAEQIAAQLGK